MFGLAEMERQETSGNKASQEKKKEFSAGLGSQESGGGQKAKHYSYKNMKN